MSDFVTDVLVTARGNRRASKRREKRLTGEMLPRMSQRSKYLATTRSAYVLPDPYRPAKRRTPTCEKPSEVVTTSAPVILPGCQECLGRYCEPRLHDVSSRSLPKTREDPDPKTLQHREKETGRVLSHREKITARLLKSRADYAAL